MTKQLNKKGTSLVELIAVIIIMGIIAGIAVPTTIAVINRQRKNAAKSSAEATFTAAKDVLMEAVGASDASIVSGRIHVTGDNPVDGFYITVADLVSKGELEKNPITSENKTTFGFGINSTTNKFYYGVVSGEGESAAFAIADAAVSITVNEKEVSVSYDTTANNAIKFTVA